MKKNNKIVIFLIVIILFVVLTAQILGFVFFKDDIKTQVIINISALIIALIGLAYLFFKVK